VEPSETGLPGHGTAPGSALTPDERAALTDARDRAHALTDAVFDTLYQPGGQEGSLDTREQALAAAMAAAAGVAAENARIDARARSHQAWHRATAEVTTRLLSEDEPRDVLEMVTRHARELAEAELVLLALPADEGDDVRIVNAAGAGARTALGLTFPISSALAQTVIATGQPLVIDDFATDDRVPEPVRRSLRLGPAVIFPLGPIGDVRGALTVGQAAGAPPMSPARMEMMTTFAAQAGIGLKLAEHRRAAQRLAVLADRDRIGRDLHDLVIQRLFATGMSLQGALPLMTTPAADRVRRAVDDLDQTVRDIRSAIFTLQPREEAAVPGVRARIVAVADSMAGALGFAPSLRLDGALDGRVPSSIAEDLLAMLREGLSNVARHAGASRAEVTVEAGGELVAVVRDDGVGMGGADPWRGLSSLARRAAILGGSLRFRPADGGGARLEWRVPLPAAPSL
jgi:signal transduction histidine kinase